MVPLWAFIVGLFVSFILGFFFAALFSMNRDPEEYILVDKDKKE